MPRARVLSFMTQWGGNNHAPRSAASQNFTSTPFPTPPASPQQTRQDHSLDQQPTENNNQNGAGGHSPILPSQDGAATPTQPPSRPPSVLAQAYQPPLMEIAQDTPPELQPIFTYLNSHSNKLYQEGYFLKLHDLDSRGRPSNDRIWNECFAQLVGTVLSLWDAAQLDAAGEDGEVIPTFINLTDASIRMIESLPMNGINGQSLQNVLSISTAANNRYLLHFNSLHSLTQWTAGIRLAMYEHATLQEAYTGSLIAGKGKYLNNIRVIMERARHPTEDWARVRFGAGTPWQRCWCVISPPDEREVQKAQKLEKKERKRSAYDRTIPAVKGDIKFYAARKVTKKTKPIATITDAFSAYAIYPQSKPLIDQSTLVKVEGLITIHSTPESTTEGFVFVMPEVHPAVTGFEMMLRWLLPVFDTFALYGRPHRLIADVLDARSLMFAMPTQRRYGYLELIDVAGLIHTEGSQKWNEREWRRQMKNLTSKRMSSAPSASGQHDAGTRSTRAASRSSLNLPATVSRTSLNLPSSRSAVKFADDNTIRSSPASRRGSPAPPAINGSFTPPRRTDSAPPGIGLANGSPHHGRSVSDAQGHKRQTEPSPLLFEQHAQEQTPPPPPQHRVHPALDRHSGLEGPPGAVVQQDQWIAPSTDGHWSERSSTPDHEIAQQTDVVMPRIETMGLDDRTLNPVEAPPTMAHRSAEKPRTKPNQMPDMRRANSAIDAETLAQLAEANRANDAMHSTDPGADQQLYANTEANAKMMGATYHPGMDNYQQGPSGYQQGPSGFQQGPGGYQQRPSVGQQGLNRFQQGPNRSQQGPNTYKQGPNGYQQGPSGYQQGSSGYHPEQYANRQGPNGMEQSNTHPAMRNNTYQPHPNTYHPMSNGEHQPQPEASRQGQNNTYQPRPNVYQPGPNMYQTPPYHSPQYQPPQYQPQQAPNLNMMQVPRQRGPAPQPRGPPPPQDPRWLPTIPGTPAFEHNRFDFENNGQHPTNETSLQRVNSNDGATRGAVPGQGSGMHGRYVA